MQNAEVQTEYAPVEQNQDKKQENDPMETTPKLIKNAADTQLRFCLDKHVQQF